MDLILFNTFISDLEVVVECTGSSVRPGQGEGCTERNFMRFSKGECRVLHLERNNCMHQYTLGPGLLERSPSEENLRGPGEQ